MRIVHFMNYQLDYRKQNYRKQNCAWGCTPVILAGGRLTPGVTAGLRWAGLHSEFNLNYKGTHCLKKKHPKQNKTTQKTEMVEIVWPAKDFTLFPTDIYVFLFPECWGKITSSASTWQLLKITFPLKDTKELIFRKCLTFSYM